MERFKDFIKKQKKEKKVKDQNPSPDPPYTDYSLLPQDGLNKSET